MFKSTYGHDSVKISRSLLNSWPSQINVSQRGFKDTVTDILLLPFVIATIITLTTSVKCESTVLTPQTRRWMDGGWKWISNPHEMLTLMESKLSDGVDVNVGYQADSQT